jgi:hypothetical protein
VPPDKANLFSSKAELQSGSDWRKYNWERNKARVHIIKKRLGVLEQYLTNELSLQDFSLEAVPLKER